MNSELGIKNLIIGVVFSLCILNSELLTHPVYAQTSTPSGEVKAEFIASPSSSIKDKIKALQDQIASKAANLKLEIQNKLQNKAYFGKLKSADSTTMVLDSNQKDLHIILTQFTQYSGTKVKDVKSLVSGDYIAALGDIDDNDNLVAKKVIKISTFKPSSIKVVMGKVTSVGDKTFTLESADKKTWNVFVKPTTTYRSNSETNFSALKNTLKVIVVGEDVSPNINARFVYILPAGFIQSNSAMQVGSSTSASKITITPTQNPKK